MWTETLGVSIQIASQEFGVYLEQRRDADIFRAGPLQHQGDAGRIEMGLESRRMLEGPDIKLVRIFERDLRLVRDGLCHWIPSLMFTTFYSLKADNRGCSRIVPKCQ